MEDKLRNFVKVLIIIVTSLAYCYYISSRIPKGKLRLLSILPIITIFILVPLLVSSVALQITLGLFIAWLANFKLLFFAFEKNPLLLSTYNDKSLPFLHFLMSTSLPIKIKQTPFHQVPTKHYLSLSFSMKMLFWSSLIRSYDYIDYMHPVIVRAVYSVRMCYWVQLIFTMSAVFARSILGCEFELQFNNPHLSTSLQDWWGKRWNLMTSTALKSTVYTPLRSFLAPILGKRWALHWAILSTFGVSGLMHELVYFYVGRVWPTWEVLWFFVIHGVCLAIEIEVKKGLKGRWRLPPCVSGVLSVGLVFCTSFWLCYIQLIKCGADIREIEEYASLIKHMKSTIATVVTENAGNRLRQ